MLQGGKRDYGWSSDPLSGILALVSTSTTVNGLLSQRVIELHKHLSLGFCCFDKPYHSHTSTPAFVFTVGVAPWISAVFGNVTNDPCLTKTSPNDTISESADHENNQIMRPNKDGQFGLDQEILSISTQPLFPLRYSYDVQFVVRNRKHQALPLGPRFPQCIARVVHASVSLALVHADARPLHDGDARAVLTGFLQ